MVRSYWIGPLFGALALTGLAPEQTPTTAVPAQASDSKERYVTVGDLGKPGQKCRVLKMWTMPNGNPAYQVQVLETGELMTVEEMGPAAKQAPGAGVRPQTTRIFHWRSNAQATAHGSPQPPANAVVLAQPFPVPSATPAPVLTAKKPEKAQVKWPPAYVTDKPSGAVAHAPEERLVPVAPPVVKKIEPPTTKKVESSVVKNVELTPAPSSLVVKTLQPVAAPVAQNVELTPLPPTPAAPKPAPAAVTVVVPTHPTPVAPKPAPVATAVVVPNTSPYNPSNAPMPVVKAPEAKPANSNFWSANTPEKKPVAADAPSAKASEAKPANSNFWHVATPWHPSTPPPAPVKSPEPATVKAPAPAAVNAETTVAQPSNWRESWGKIPSPKPAPVHTEERVATTAAPKVELTPAAPKVETPKAAPKVELPHAVVEADDPLKTPEKFTNMPDPDEGAFGGAHKKEAKRPFLAMFASNPPAPPAPKSEEKKPESPTATVPPPPAPVVPAAAPASADIAPPTVTIPPPAPAQLVPPAAKVASPAPAQLVPPAAKVASPAPAQLVPPPAKIAPLAAAKPAPAPAEVKPEAKPTPPLGMQSVLAAQSPELAPPTPMKPVGASQTQAMGLDPNEANAFTEPSPGGKAAVASNGFWAPQRPAPAANYQPEVTAWRDATRPTGYAPPPLAPSAAVPVAQAAYRQEMSPELSQLSTVMHESLYPSQREWAADRLASIDWRREPQVLELLIERAKQDAAPMVRAECLRSLGHMRCDAPAVIDAVKSCKSDANLIVSQEADDVFAKLSGMTPAR